MSELKEKILNGLANVVLIGLPIALVLIFGEKFSLWINILAIGCALFISSLLSSIIGDEYEAPRRILHALIGASIAVCLNALAYPGHTAVIIMVTILVICTADIIQRGKILWLEFARSARIHSFGKFIFLATFLFIISLVIANFGSQKIWIPIAAASLIILVLFINDNYFDYNGSDDSKIIYLPIGALFLVGIISTIIQFSAVEIFWGIKIWETVIVLVTLIIIAVISISISEKRKHKANLLKLKKRKAAQRQEFEEKLMARKQIEKEKKEREEREEREKMEKIENDQSGLLSAIDMAFLYENNKDLGVKLIFEKKIDTNNLCENIIVSNHKRKIVWNGYLRDSLSLLSYVSKKEFDDEKLNQILRIINIIKTDVYNRKKELCKYEGEDTLQEILQQIKSFVVVRE